MILMYNLQSSLTIHKPCNIALRVTNETSHNCDATIKTAFLFEMVTLDFKILKMKFSFVIA